MNRWRTSPAIFGIALGVVFGLLWVCLSPLSRSSSALFGEEIERAEQAFVDKAPPLPTGNALPQVPRSSDSYDLAILQVSISSIRAAQLGTHCSRAVDLIHPFLLGLPPPAFA